MADPADETTDEQSSEDETPRGLRARIEEQARLRREATEKADRLERELTLHRAGLGSLSDRQQKALFAAHEGDVTAETLKATADELFGSATGSPSPETPTQTPAEAANAAGFDKLDEFAKGGASVEPPQPAKEAFAQAVEGWTGTREELMDFIFAKNQHLLDS